MTSAAVLTRSHSELLAACEVQQGFLQHRAPALDTLSYSGRCRQLGEVGGDCYDFVPLPDGRLAFAIGDASGKGVAAALMIANVQSSLRTAALFTGDDVAATVAVVSRHLYQSSLAGSYATLFYGILDTRTRVLQYVNAGHNPPMLVRADGSVLWLEAGGLPVGLFPDCHYASGTVQLERGDLIVGYTDGIVEAPNAAGEEWGVDGLRNAVLANDADCADDVVDAIFSALDHVWRARQVDDATILALQVR